MNITILNSLVVECCLILILIVHLAILKGKKMSEVDILTPAEVFSLNLLVFSLISLLWLPRYPCSFR